MPASNTIISEAINSYREDLMPKKSSNLKKTSIPQNPNKFIGYSNNMTIDELQDYITTTSITTASSGNITGTVGTITTTDTADFVIYDNSLFSTPFIPVTVPAPTADSKIVTVLKKNKTIKPILLLKLFYKDYSNVLKNKDRDKILECIQDTQKQINELQKKLNEYKNEINKFDSNNNVINTNKEEETKRLLRELEEIRKSNKKNNEFNPYGNGTGPYKDPYKTNIPPLKPYFGVDINDNPIISVYSGNVTGNFVNGSTNITTSESEFYSETTNSTKGDTFSTIMSILPKL